MKDERFNELFDGPLGSPRRSPGVSQSRDVCLETIERLFLALRCVVEATHPAGEEALEAWCAMRQAQDNQDKQEFRQQESLDSA